MLVLVAVVVEVVCVVCVASPYEEGGWAIGG